MSNETVSKPRTRRSPAEGTSTAAERPAAEVSETTKKPVVPKEIDPNQMLLGCMPMLSATRLWIWSMRCSPWRGMKNLGLVRAWMIFSSS